MGYQLGGYYLLLLTLSSFVGTLPKDSRSTGYQSRKQIAGGFEREAEGRRLSRTASEMSLPATNTAASNENRRVARNSASLDASRVIDLVDTDARSGGSTATTVRGELLSVSRSVRIPRVAVVDLVRGNGVSEIPSNGVEPNSEPPPDSPEPLSEIDVLSSPREDLLNALAREIPVPSSATTPSASSSRATRQSTLDRLGQSEARNRILEARLAELSFARGSLTQLQTVAGPGQRETQLEVPLSPPADTEG